MGSGRVWGVEGDGILTRKNSLRGVSLSAWGLVTVSHICSDDEYPHNAEKKE